MEDAVSQAKSEFIRAKDRLTNLFAQTPDDKINWSPSASSRTPVQLVAHCAEAIRNINRFLDGHPFEIKDPAKADDHFRELESRYNTREQALGFLNQVSSEYVAWLDVLTPDKLATIIELPFGFGTAPVSDGLAFPWRHTQAHIAQIEYIQTIFGDHDWHL